jgi:hypothetical protein
MKLSDFLHLPPFHGLVEAINAQYALNFHPQRTYLDTLTVAPDDPRRIQVQLSTNRSVSDRNLDPVIPPYEFSYQRLDLATYFNSDGEVVLDDLYGPFGANRVIDRLCDKTGWVLLYSDFESTYYSNPEPNDVLVLKAHPMSLRWSGELRFRVSVPSVPLDTTVHTTRIPDALPESQEAKTPGAYVLMDIDFTDSRDDLYWLEPGDDRLASDRLVKILRRHSKLSWQIRNQQSVFNLTWEVVTTEAGGQYPKYRILYNGPVRRQWTPRMDRQRVLVIAVSPYYCFNLSGTVLLHYD